MKAHFKYAFLTGLHLRGYAFAVILLLNLVGVIFGALGLLPIGAQIAFVALSGTAIGVMVIFNVIGDIGIFGQMLGTPRSYLHALTPMHRRQTLIAGLLAVAVMDVVTMTVAISGVTWLAIILAGNYVDIHDFIRSIVMPDLFNPLSGFASALSILAGYLLLVTFIVSCVIVGKSVFYQKRGGGFLTFLVAIGALYLHSISLFVLVPFGTISGYWGFYSISIGREGLLAYGVLLLIQVAALIMVSGHLMERKLNI